MPPIDPTQDDDETQVGGGSLHPSNRSNDRVLSWDLGHVATQLNLLGRLKDRDDVNSFWPRLAPKGSEEFLLTSTILAKRIAPMVDAIERLQAFANLGRIAAYPEPRVILILQNSPIEFSMSGVVDAYKAIRDDIIPWRARHNKEFAALEQAEKLLRLRGLQFELKRTQASSHSALDLEVKMIEVEKQRLEVLAQTANLKASQVRLAIEVMEKLFPSATEQQRLENFSQVLTAIGNLDAVYVAPKALPPDGSKPS